MKYRVKIICSYKNHYKRRGPRRMLKGPQSQPSGILYFAVLCGFTAKLCV